MVTFAHDPRSWRRADSYRSRARPAPAPVQHATNTRPTPPPARQFCRDAAVACPDSPVERAWSADPGPPGRIVRNAPINPGRPEIRVSLVEGHSHPTLAPRHQSTPWQVALPVGHASYAEPPADLGTGAPNHRPPARHPTCRQPSHCRRLLTEVRRRHTDNNAVWERPRRASRPRRESVADQPASLQGRLADRDRAILGPMHEHPVFTSHQLIWNDAPSLACWGTQT